MSSNELRELVLANSDHISRVLFDKLNDCIDVMDSNENEAVIVQPLRELIRSLANPGRVPMQSIFAYLNSPGTQMSSTLALFEDIVQADQDRAAILNNQADQDRAAILNNQDRFQGLDNFMARFRRYDRNME